MAHENPRAGSPLDQIPRGKTTNTAAYTAAVYKTWVQNTVSGSGIESRL
jgi:hypothetical protein